MLILQTIKVQAVEKIANNTNWITIIILALLVMVVILKTIDSKKLKGYVFALFNKGFVATESEEEIPFFSFFYMLIFGFSTIVFSLIVALLIAETKSEINYNFSFFTYILSIVFTYFFIKRLLEIVLNRLFSLKKYVHFYLVSKFSYLYFISFFLLISYILIVFSGLNSVLLIYAVVFFFLLRFVFHINSNKKLVFNNFFYFILYLCAFEIAPLLVLFKLLL